MFKVITAGALNQLRHTIHTLQEENVHLITVAEEALLLGLVSDTLQNIDDKIDILANTLEQISILKSIPYCVCGLLSDQQSTIKVLSSYCTSSEDDDCLAAIKLGNGLLRELHHGPVVSDNLDALTIDFSSFAFSPACFAIIPFVLDASTTGIFLFISNIQEKTRLAAMMPTLHHATDIAVSKYKNIHLLEKLQQMNAELEQKISQRTAELSAANAHLEREMAVKEASQKALQESHESFLTILNSIDAMVHAVDLETHTILFMNQYMIDAIGGDFTGSKCFQRLRNGSSPCTDCANNQLLDHNRQPAGVQIWEEQNPINGRWYINHDRAVKWTDGRMVRIQIATDITRMKEMEAQLLQAQKMDAIGTLAGGIAHDFNNILTGIQGHASLLLADHTLAPDQRERLEAIEQYVHSAAELSNRMLGLAKGGKYHGTLIDVNELITHSLNLFSRTRKALTTHCLLATKPPVISADRNQLEQVLLNLFINAWQAMSEAGELTVSSAIVALDEDFCAPHEMEAGTYAAIRVTDNGAGIPAADISRVFDPFFTTKHKDRGSGLGLASCYAIIRNHSGLITVESQEGSGSTFTCYLPHVEAEVVPPPLKNSGSITGAGKILLVDDEEVVLEVAEAMLERLGYSVTVAQGGQRAIDILEQKAGSFDLLIIDMVMPGVDGKRVCAQAAALGYTGPILIASGYSANGEVKELLDKGVQGFIHKPFGLSDLSQKIHQVLKADHP